MLVIIGTTTIDIFIQSQKDAAARGDDGFRTSNLIFTDQPLNLLLGGNGGISAYVAASLGWPTALCSAVGQDPLGDLAAGWLEARGVNLEGFCRSVKRATSTSTILLTGASGQVVYHHLGATADICLEHIPRPLLNQAEVLLATGFHHIPQMRTGGFAQALRAVFEAGGLTALDIGPAIGDPVTLAELLPLLPYVDYLIGNTYELAVVTGHQDWETAAAWLVGAGARQVVIKRGAAGAALHSATTQVEAAGVPVEANITVGAGDSFNVGFLYGRQQRWPSQQALRFGNAVAALVVSGSQGVLDAPTRPQVETFLASLS